MAARPSPSRYRRPDLLSASRWHSWNSLRAAYPSPKDPPHCWSWSGLCCYLNQGSQEWSGPCLRPAAMVPRSNSEPIVERLRKIQSSSSYHVPWPASHTGSLNSHRCLGVAIGLFGRANVIFAHFEWHQWFQGEILAMCQFFHPVLGPIPTSQILLTLDLLEDDCPIPELVHCDLVSRAEVQAVSDSKRKLNPAVGINICHQTHSPKIPGCRFIKGLF